MPESPPKKLPISVYRRLELAGSLLKPTYPSMVLLQDFFCSQVRFRSRQIQQRGGGGCQVQWCLSLELDARFGPVNLTVTELDFWSGSGSVQVRLTQPWKHYSVCTPLHYSSKNFCRFSLLLFRFDGPANRFAANRFPACVFHQFVGSLTDSTSELIFHQSD
jgi:hypothetical protein